MESIFIWQDSLSLQSRMAMRQNVNNDVSMNPPIIKKAVGTSTALSPGPRGQRIKNSLVSLLLIPYCMKFWQHVNLAILKNPY